ncbi:MAG: asparagine synthase (glutamine-hydrolyzing) [Saprospiraceae bacterium]|nr:asparagine synthase (glutamine-hydrolyzing) [Saprospiraceae bacterium]
MCGLAGIFDPDGKPVDLKQLRAMTAQIRHRGPDDEGFLLAHAHSGDLSSYAGADTLPELASALPALPAHTHCNLGLGFRRLAIIDVSASGHQPMVDPSGRCALTFNGEIYNYREIRAELEARGCCFTTQSDSEVLLQAYCVWGKDCLQHFVGMFAFAIWDGANKRLFIARDRLGIKPLVYTRVGHTFYWASEEKQLVRAARLACTPNEDAILRLLRDNALFEHPDTFFNEIHQLPAACYATIDASGMRIERYWSIPHPQGRDLQDVGTAQSALLEMLNQSLALRLRSDVPLGIALSGGIDSSTIACLARSLNAADIRTFSVYYEGSKYDERPYMDAVIRTGGFQPVYYTAHSGADATAVQEWIFHQDAPTSGASPFSSYQNYKNVRDAGIVVLLNGQGGDELFAGYPYYLKYLLAQQCRKDGWPVALRSLWTMLGHQGPRFTAAQAYLAWQTGRLEPARLRALEYRKYAMAALYPPDAPSELPPRWSDDLLENALHASVVRTHLPHMLRWEDRNSMAHSVEARVPLLDHRLVELAFRIPGNLKIHQGIQKFILREAVRGLVPEAVLQRTDKIGFATPTVDWTLGSLRDDIADTLHSTGFLSRSWVHASAVRDQFDRNPRAFGENELWRIANVEWWYRAFFETPLTPNL